LDYPETDEAYDHFHRDLVERKATPSGLMIAQYACLDWFHTNNMMIPKLSTFKQFAPRDGPLPTSILTLRSDNIVLMKDDNDLVPKIVISTKVVDYRYKKTNSSRIFKYAEYELKPGEAWKPANDPVLLDRANDWLKNGAEYTVYIDSDQPTEGPMTKPLYSVWEDNRKKWVLLFLLAVIVIPAVAMGLKKRSQPK